MGWSYRKSFGAGPFRINFSKSGISYSVGVKGARVNMGPMGTYVNLSSHGISYRRKIANGTLPSHQSVPQQVSSPTLEAVHHIASADIGQLTDTDSKDFIAELTQKAGQISYTKWFGIFPFIVFLVILLFTSFSTKTRVINPATDSTLVRVTSGVGVNIRKNADARSAILTSATYGQTFQLADSTNRKWLKVNIASAEGYIHRQFAEIAHVHHNEATSEETYLANPYAGYILVIGIIGFVFLIIRLQRLDKTRFEMELQYDMDEQFKQVYQQFGNHFATFSSSARIWQYLNAQRTLDYKRNGGAGNLIKRTPIHGISVNQAPLPHFITNIAIPHLRLSNIEFYFLPERLLIKRGDTFAAVFYKNLNINGYTSQFIEDELVPRDAKIIGHTWRYVNKSGGPDRRFNNNRQIPICAYSQYTLTSDTGIYEVLTTSKQGAMDAFANFLLQIGQLQSKMAIS
ncbi:DUF4236 domain-containing protein [Mucilaginibacter paludis]|uniref:SH3 type 3 domain protein n=1 Tax=Mucilaginibacter paludis DSM 18603 TaxID=714943 RepID=H1Y8I0_9SPHI|nr:DUF4236 domain-containing protein [Mucilaginibacter paludis]EHQ25898.1 SH3 type 3 domain protein [Mucilaginibacter paludis DSM 18603]